MTEEITELSLTILLNKLRPHMTYCGFSWTEKGKKIYYIFCVVPFGLSVSGLTSKPVCSHFLAKVQFSYGGEQMLLGASISMSVASLRMEFH